MQAKDSTISDLEKKSNVQGYEATEAGPNDISTLQDQIEPDASLNN
jgi:hypothetical protein